MVISFLGKLPNIMLYFQIYLISFFGNVFTLCLVYIPAGGVFYLLVLSLTCINFNTANLVLQDKMKVESRV